MNFFTSRINFGNDKNEMLETFKVLDKNGDGVLNKKEFIDGFKEIYPLLREEIIIDKVNNIFNIIDCDNSGEVDFTEFINVLLFYSNNKKYDKIREVFKLLDKDQNGFLEKSEFEELLEDKDINRENWLDIIKEIDINNDGKICFDEFMDLFK